MKKLLLPLFSLTSLWANADVVLEQKIEATTMNGSMLTRIKGDLARVDMPALGVGEVSLICDLKAGQLTTLVHGRKGFLKGSIDEYKKKTEELQKAAAGDLPKDETPKTTGQKEKINDWDTEIFEGVVAGNKMKFWVAKDFPGYKPINAQMSKFFAAMGTASFNPAKTDLGGMIVKTETTLAKDKGKVTTTLAKAKEEPVDETIFKAPEGYGPIEVDPAPK